MVPAGLMLSEYETETANALARRVQPIFAERLALALEEVDSDYDIVLIDCPPQLGFLTLTALAASTGLLVTVVPGMLDIASMSQFLKLASETVKAVEEAIGRHVTWDFVKFLITRYEPSDGPQTQMAGYLRSILAGQVMTEPMLKSTAISDAGMTQQTIYEVDPSQLIRKTIDRALTSVNSVADELEQTIQMAWGRR
jgi:chromosome partitioning protein